MNAVPFSKVLELLESHGWELEKVCPPNRIFCKTVRDPRSPTVQKKIRLCFPVKDRKVRRIYVEKIKRILSEGEES